jgi:glycine dehydrogenase subunit 2
MDAFCLHPAGGSQAIFTNILIMKAFHKYNGNQALKDEVITTILSHPGNPGAAATAGYKIITLYPDENGRPDMEQLKKSVSQRTAGLLITNPEDTGIYNPGIREIVDIVHSAGGLCIYDQANLNGLFGIARAREAGFDMCHYNLHKSFSAPHGSQGPASGATGVIKELEKFLPLPVLCHDGNKYYFDYDRPYSIGKIRKFYGNPAVALRAYAYIRSLGAEGLKQVAELSILNNSYLLHKLKDVRGLSLPVAKDTKRIEQSRLSWEELKKDTGVSTDDVNRRIVDYGVQSYFASHHPRVYPEPFTPEPTETYSKSDIDEYARIIKDISDEAYNNPELVKTAPHNTALTSQIIAEYLSDIKLLSTTWRAYKRRCGEPII